jgi:hypothetical protein
MIRYYFDFVADGRVCPDKEGLILSGIESARREASLSLADLAQDKLRSERSISSLAITVRTDDGPVCEAVFHWISNPYSKALGSAVRPEGKKGSKPPP